MLQYSKASSSSPPLPDVRLRSPLSAGDEGGESSEPSTAVYMMSRSSRLRSRNFGMLDALVLNAAMRVERKTDAMLVR